MVYFCLLLAGMVINGFLEVTGVFSVLPFLTLAFTPDVVHRNRYAQHALELSGLSPQNFVLTLGLACCGFLFFSTMVNVIVLGYFHRLAGRFCTFLSAQRFEEILHEPYEAQLARKDSKEAAINDGFRVAHGILIPALIIGSRAAIVLLMLIALCLYNALWTLAIVAYFGIFFGINYLALQRRLASLGNLYRESSVERVAILDDSLATFKEIQLYASEAHFMRRFAEVTQRWSDSSFSIQYYPLVPRYLSEVFTFMGAFLVIAVLARNNASMQHYAPILSLYGLAGVRLLPACQHAFFCLTTIRSHTVYFPLVKKYLLGPDLSSPFSGASERRMSESFQPSEVVLDNLMFRHRESEAPVLQDISLTLVRNSRVAFVGETGCGKTTLVDLICGFFAPTSGRVLFDGKPADAESLRRWQNTIAYVNQSYWLISGSLSRNVAFGHDQIDQSRVLEAMKAARCEELLARWGDVDTLELNRKLSGGERQRVCIARALYQEADVIIFDEATSSLDSRTEDEVVEMIAALPRPVTFISVAHKLKSIQSFDQIYLLKSGSIVAQGTFQELLQSSAEFRNMARRQSLVD